MMSKQKHMRRVAMSATLASMMMLTGFSHDDAGTVDGETHTSFSAPTYEGEFVAQSERPTPVPQTPRNPQQPQQQQGQQNQSDVNQNTNQRVVTPTTPNNQNVQQQQGSQYNQNAQGQYNNQPQQPGQQHPNLPQTNNSPIDYAVVGLAAAFAIGAGGLLVYRRQAAIKNMK